MGDVELPNLSSRRNNYLPKKMGLPKPIGRQKEVLTLPAHGHFAVLGTAGSGKSNLVKLVYLANLLISGESRYHSSLRDKG